MKVTKTGSAVQWADFTAMNAVTENGKPQVELVLSRCAVVLIVVDGTAPPVRSELDLIAAVSGATGRCAVGLAGAPQPTDPAWLAWRREIDPAIPVGALDAAMVRTLVLLAEGPPNPITPTPMARIRELLTQQLQAEREFRATRAKKAVEDRGSVQKRNPSDDEHDVADALDTLSASITSLGDAGELNVRSMRAATTRTGDRLAEIAGLSQPMPSPEPPEREATSYGVEIAAAVLTFGAAIGASRVFVDPLQLLGIGPMVANGVAIVVGLFLATVVAVGGGRRKARHRNVAWAARHVAQVRRQWLRHIAQCRAAESAAEVAGATRGLRGVGDTGGDASDWRARALAKALKMK